METFEVSEQEPITVERQNINLPLNLRNISVAALCSGIAMLGATNAPEVFASEQEAEKALTQNNSGNIYPSSSSGTEVDASEQTGEDPKTTIQRQICRDFTGINGLNRLRVTNRVGKATTKRVTVITPFVENCDTFGTRTIKSISFLSRGNKQKSWVSSDVMVKNLVGNKSRKVTRIVDLKTKCKRNDSHLLIREKAVVSYREKDTGIDYKKTQLLPMRSVLKLKCPKP